eukprot:783890-Rhodomonas_salina.1
MGRVISAGQSTLIVSLQEIYHRVMTEKPEKTAALSRITIDVPVCGLWLHGGQRGADRETTTETLIDGKSALRISVARSQTW